MIKRDDIVLLLDLEAIWGEKDAGKEFLDIHEEPSYNRKLQMLDAIYTHKLYSQIKQERKENVAYLRANKALKPTS